MKKLTLYQYFLLRAEKRTDSIVQDLVDDMTRDKELIGMSGAQIVSHICWNGCSGAVEALRQFLCAYRAYCKRNGFEYEKDAFDEIKKWR